MEGAKRADRVGERIRTELMDLFLRGVVRDPAVEGCFVSGVKLSDDLRNARIYVRLTRDGATEQDRERCVVALNRARGYIRRELAPKLALKYQPDLKFFWDANVDHANRIDELLAEIHEEDGLQDH